MPHFAPLGVMPGDIEFNSYNPCQDCTCDLVNSSGYRMEDEDVIPHPLMVLWDYVGGLVQVA
jgi:hypothetical protein